MKDALQLKMVEILTAIQSAVGKSADFALEQLPDIAQQYVLYGRCGAQPACCGGWRSWRLPSGWP